MVDEARLAGHLLGGHFKTLALGVICIVITHYLDFSSIRNAAVRAALGLNVEYGVELAVTDGKLALFLIVAEMAFVEAV